jgi:hypothetical protein
MRRNSKRFCRFHPSVAGVLSVSGGESPPKLSPRNGFPVHTMDQGLDSAVVLGRWTRPAARRRELANLRIAAWFCELSQKRRGRSIISHTSIV